MPFNNLTSPSITKQKLNVGAGGGGVKHACRFGTDGRFDSDFYSFCHFHAETLSKGQIGAGSSLLALATSLVSVFARVWSLSRR